MKPTKKLLNGLCMLLAPLLLMASSLPAYGAASREAEKEDDPDKTLAPYFFVQGDDSSTDSFPLKGTKVSTTINGTIAETYVTQVYEPYLIQQGLVMRTPKGRQATVRAFDHLGLRAPEGQ